MLKWCSNYWNEASGRKKAGGIYLPGPAEEIAGKQRTEEYTMKKQDRNHIIKVAMAIILIFALICSVGCSMGDTEVAFKGIRFTLPGGYELIKNKDDTNFGDDYYDQYDHTDPGITHRDYYHDPVLGETTRLMCTCYGKKYPYADAFAVFKESVENSTVGSGAALKNTRYRTEKNRRLGTINWYAYEEKSIFMATGENKMNAVNGFFCTVKGKTYGFEVFRYNDDEDIKKGHKENKEELRQILKSIKKGK